MVSIRDYAKMNNVSYEAIRQQVKRYEDELNGHIIKQNRTQFLDDVAVDILDQHRKENPVVIINKDTDSRLKQLEDENKNLLIKVAQQADKISQLNEDLKNKIEQMTSLMLENKEKTSLLEQKKDQAEEINQLKEQLDQEKKGVDFGIWEKIDPKFLSVPLDVHTANISRKLGILNRTQNDWKAVEELDKIIRKYNPEDPAIYDYALFGIGVSKEFL